MVRQVVSAPGRAYLPVLALPAYILIRSVIDLGTASWVDYLWMAAFSLVLVGLSYFFLHLAFTQVILISDTTLMVRETLIPLEDIVGCAVIDPPEDARFEFLRYRRETLTRLYLVVPYRTNYLVEVTRAQGKALVFSAENPEAVCDALRQKCRNLA